MIIEHTDPQLPVYVSGSFNNWQVSDPAYKATITQNRQQILIPGLAKGSYAFKFNRGNWNSVETDANCNDVPNRIVSIQHDTTIFINTLYWKDIQYQQLRGEALFEYYLAQAFHFLPYNLDSSVYYALKNLAMPEARGSTRLATRSINIQGELFQRLGNTTRALQLFQRALGIQSKLKDTGSMAFLHSQMANAYWAESDTIHALAHYYALNDLSNESLRHHPIHDIYTDAFTQIARYHWSHAQTDSMNYYLYKASQVGDKQSAKLSLFLGELAHSRGNEDSAIYWWNHVVELPGSGISTAAVSIEAMMHLGEIYNQFNQYDDALAQWQHANQLALQTGNKSFFVTSADLISNYYLQQHQPDSALAWKDRSIRFLDKEQSAERKLQTLGNVFMAQIGNLEQTDLIRRNRLRILVLGMLTLALVAGLGWFWYRRRLHYRFEKQMKEIEIKALRAQMNPHFIFNCLTSINSLIVKQNQRAASEYLVRFAKLMRSILDNASTDKVSLAAELNALHLYVDMELLRFRETFEYEISVDESLSTESIEIPSMIIQPYVENAIWHGLMHMQGKGKLTIAIKEKLKGMLQVSIEDNGIGRKAAAQLRQMQFLDHKSYGMKISQDRIDLMNYFYGLKGNSTVNDLYNADGKPMGTCVLLSIPYES